MCVYKYNLRSYRTYMSNSSLVCIICIISLIHSLHIIIMLLSILSKHLRCTWCLYLNLTYTHTRIRIKMKICRFWETAPQTFNKLLINIEDKTIPRATIELYHWIQIHHIRSFSLYSYNYICYSKTERFNSPTIAYKYTFNNLYPTYTKHQTTNSKWTTIFRDEFSEFLSRVHIKLNLFHKNKLSARYIKLKSI